MDYGVFYNRLLLVNKIEIYLLLNAVFGLLWERVVSFIAIGCHFSQSPKATSSVEPNAVTAIPQVSRCTCCIGFKWQLIVCMSEYKLRVYLIISHNLQILVPLLIRARARLSRCACSYGICIIDLAVTLRKDVRSHLPSTSRVQHERTIPLTRSSSSRQTPSPPCNTHPIVP